MSIAALIIIVIHEAENSLIRNKQINRSGSCHAVEHYLPIKRNEVILATTWVNLESMLSNRSQS